MCDIFIGDANGYVTLLEHRPERKRCEINLNAGSCSHDDAARVLLLGLFFAISIPVGAMQ